MILDGHVHGKLLKNDKTYENIQKFIKTNERNSQLFKKYGESVAKMVPRTLPGRLRGSS